MQNLAPVSLSQGLQQTVLHQRNTYELLFFLIMPPKKAQAAKAVSKKGAKLPSHSKKDSKDVKHDAEAENNDAVEEPEPVEANGDHAGKKRKSPPTTDSKSTKVARQSSRGSASQPTPKQVLNFLLSKDSLRLCFPDDELDFARDNPKSRSYSLTSPSEFTPWEHLVCAHLLSKPLSHALGMRSIRTLLNPPYSFNTAVAAAEAGEKRIWEGLEDARTQHRQKTAAYISGMADEFVDDNEGGKAKREMMFELSEKANDEGSGGVISFIKANINGMGQTGAEVFCRRVQCVDGWGDAIWPFVDGKARDALVEVGLKVKDAEELQNMIESEADWSKIGDMGLNERGLSKGELSGEEMDVQVQSEFVVLVERALGCVLQKNVAELKKAAAAL